MKAARFEYERPESLTQAIRLLGSEECSAKVLAGGQSFGPMLNLRLVAPKMLVDVTGIPELVCDEDETDAVVLGACITHATIEDGRATNRTREVMARVAHGIAYRAIRNRGTIGGSLAHADPSADWISSLAALGAELVVFGTSGLRTMPISKLMLGAFETALAPDEILQTVRIPKLSAGARWGFYKICRKTGAFADAMAAVLWDPDRGVRRAVIGSTNSAPIIIDDAEQLLDNPQEKDCRGLVSESSALRLLRKEGLDDDPYSLRISLVALQRAFAQANKQ